MRRVGLPEVVAELGGAGECHGAGRGLGPPGPGCGALVEGRGLAEVAVDVLGRAEDPEAFALGAARAEGVGQCAQGGAVAGDDGETGLLHQGTDPEVLGQPLQRGQGLERAQGVGDRPAEQGEAGLHDLAPELGRQVVELLRQLRELPGGGAGRLAGRGRVRLGVGGSGKVSNQTSIRASSARARALAGSALVLLGERERLLGEGVARLLATEHELGDREVRQGLGRGDAQALGTAQQHGTGEVLLRRGKQAQPVLGHADLEQHEGEMGVRDRRIRRPLHLGQGGVHQPLLVLTTDARAVQQDAVVLERRDRPRVCLLVAEQPVGPVPSGVRVACRPPRPGDEPPRGGVLVDRRAGRPEEGVDALVLAGHDQPGAVLGQHRAGVVVAAQHEEAAHGVGGVAAGQVRPRGPEDRRGGALHVDAPGDQAPAHDLAQQRVDAVALLATRRTGHGGHLAHEQPGGLQ